MDAEQDLYRDRWVRCTDDRVVISGYYFPTRSSKSIPYREIRSVTAVRMSTWRGRFRLWGTAAPRYWAHLDLARPKKTTALVLDTGHRVKPFVTPEDADRVREIIEIKCARVEGQN